MTGTFRIAGPGSPLTLHPALPETPDQPDTSNSKP
jgi:hypothetical protein